MELPSRSPRRNRKKEEEEIRELGHKLMQGERKWIPLLPTTPPVLVKLKVSLSVLVRAQILWMTGKSQSVSLLDLNFIGCIEFLCLG